MRRRLLMAGLVVVMACGGDTPPPTTEPDPTEVRLGFTYGWARSFVIEAPSGRLIECVTLNGDGGVGLSCDWGAR
jgi:hypothetical protein